MNATERLAAAAVDASGDRPDLEQHLLDWLAVTVGGAKHADSTPAILGGVDRLTGGGGAGPAAEPDGGTAVRAPEAAGGGRATVLPSGDRLRAADAALANGALAHSLDFDDTHLASSLHPGAPTIAAALAVAEARDAPVGRLLDGIAAGYDVACRLGAAVNPDVHYDRGFHITATCGTFGATAAAGVVAGLDADELANAFGINGSQAAGSLQFLENGAWNKRLHPGLAARRAVEAVAFAESGFVGAAEPITGEHGFFAAYTDDPILAEFDRLDRDAVAETGLKPYPCCRYLHPAIDGLLAIATDVDPDAVESVRLGLPRAGVRLTGDPIDAKRRPDSFVDAQFSGPFVAALALSAGAAGGDAFLRAVGRLAEPAWFDDPDFRRLLDATGVAVDDEVQARFPGEWCARVVVETAGGRHERFVETPYGEPGDPMSPADTARKARGLVATGDRPLDADRLVAAVEGIRGGSVADLVAAATYGD